MPSEQPSIDILLATYKGGANFEVQLDSLREQTCTDYNLIIRDDACDPDVTKQIEALSGCFPGKVSLLEDHDVKIGPLQSFSRLLESATSDYIMLCDHDDVWLPNKIETTLAKMQRMEEEHGKETPMLVHSDLSVVDNGLELKAKSLWQHQNIHPRNRELFNRLLVQNVVTGCTVMINKALRELASPVPEQAIMHDWWLALVAAAFGKIGHLDLATLLYRQHDRNEVGAKQWDGAFVRKHAFGNDGQVKQSIARQQRQAQAFLEVYHDKLSDDFRAVAECYATLDRHPYPQRIWLLIKHRLFKAGLTRNIGMWAHI